MPGSDSEPLDLPDTWSPQRVDVEVWGGLGNRLFMLAAAFSVARKLELPLRVLTHRPTSAEQLLGGLQFDRVLAGMDRSPELSLLPPARCPGVRRGREKIRQVSQRVGIARRERLEGGRIRRHIEDGVESVRLQGYFQSLATVIRAIDFGWPVTVPVTPADAMWSLPIIEEAGTLGPTGIHIRRGDYLHAANVHRLGNPAPSFFQSALDRVGGDSRAEIWLFSDDPSDAQQLLRDRAAYIRRTFGPKDTPSEAAALAIMSATPGLVIGNSTFAWWGAFWGAHPRGVAYPRPWHDRVDGESLASPGWIPVPKQSSANTRDDLLQEGSQQACR